MSSTGFFLLFPWEVELDRKAWPLEGHRGTSLIKTSPPPQDHHRAFGTTLLQGLRRGVFLMSEVPLLRLRVCGRGAGWVAAGGGAVGSTPLMA